MNESEDAPSIAEAETELLAVKMMLAIALARDDLVIFIRLCMAHPDHPGNPDYSLYEVEPHHRMLADAVTQVQARAVKRFALSIPPQHGKSTILSHFGVAWMIGKDPHEHIIVGTYGSDFAKSIGEHVREIIQSPIFQQIFPNVTVSKSSASKSDLGIRYYDNAAGSVRFRGRGEATTGLPATRFIIDDPYKDRKEAESTAILKEAKDWYNGVVFSRLRATATIIIVHTRWAEDDMIGGLCDPEHPEYDYERAKRWTFINVPAVVTDKGLADALKMKLEVPTDPVVIQQFGKRPMAALWPGPPDDLKFPLEHLAEARENDPRLFTALYMGSPAPDDGSYFKSEMIVEYDPADLPKNLHYYAASDHALTEKQENDPWCLGCVGIDEDDHIWILPDLFWERVETDEGTEAMLDQMIRHRPLVWWAERDHISKAIGPFLKTRMREERCYTYIEESPAIKELRVRARAIQGRMSMKMVHFPKFAPWYQRARNELLKFPAAKHDDFVSFIGHMGMGLDKLAKARKPKKSDDNVIRVGSMAWVKSAHNIEQREAKRLKAVGGM